MKELIEKYKNRIDFLQRNRSFEVLGHIDFIAQREVKVLLDTISDLESLQYKGKTKEEVLRACFPEQESGYSYDSLDKMTKHCISLAMEEYAQSHANKDGKIEQLFKELKFWSNIYEFSFQFWGEGNNNIWIYKGGVELFSCGNEESIEDVIQAALNYIHRINPNETKPQI